MSAKIFTVQHWRAAQNRRAQAELVAIRQQYAGQQPARRLTLDEVMGWGVPS